MFLSLYRCNLVFWRIQVVPMYQELTLLTKWESLINDFIHENKNSFNDDFYLAKCSGRF